MIQNTASCLIDTEVDVTSV
uniref:Uncharacterized protein n=1 Tax=Arundo donax TaxID=35708 RepID=A0A0A9GTQ3_ARUDO